MNVVFVDLLTDMRELPILATITLASVGFLLFVTGWWAHRFWVVLASCIAAGIVGLRISPDFGVQPLVGGILSAVAAGVLALSLVKAAVFLGCGVGAWLVTDTLIPEWGGPLVWFLVGGMVGLFLFRFCIISGSSAAGAQLMLYGGLDLAARVTDQQAAQWVTERGYLIDIGFFSTVFVGVVGQYIMARILNNFKKRRTELRALKQQHLQQHHEQTTKGWSQYLRKAG